MNPDFHDLERTWMGAVQRRDAEALGRILDDQFVCTSWSSDGALTTREEYLNSMDSAAFGGCTVSLDQVQMLESTAVVRCRLECECMIADRGWNAVFLVTDVWVRRGATWKAVSRHASVPVGEWQTLMTSQGAGVFGDYRAAAPKHRVEGA